MKATRDAFGNHFPAMGDKYDNIVALDADLGKATKIASFKESHIRVWLQSILSFIWFFFNR